MNAGNSCIKSNCLLVDIVDDVRHSMDKHWRLLVGAEEGDSLLD
jgi:hypothetical protein